MVFKIEKTFPLRNKKVYGFPININNFSNLEKIWEEINYT